MSTPSAQSLQFHVVFRPEPEGGYTVIVPSLPGCITYGRTIKKAQEMATEAIELYLESMAEDGEEIVSDQDTLTGTIHVSALAHA